HPVSEYRLMGWRTYYYGMKGTGFWNYADVGRLNENLITSNAQNLERDYAVIYISPKGDIVSSRRWEAFKLGIEDYQLLLCHENIFGRKATLKLIKNLVSLDEDNPQIDLIRNQLISNIFPDE